MSIKPITAAFITCGLIVGMPASTQASSPDAWAALDKRVARACLAKSSLVRPKLLAGKIGFSDEIMIEVRLIAGSDRRGRTRHELCAHNRKTGKTEVQEAVGWSIRPTKP